MSLAELPPLPQSPIRAASQVAAMQGRVAALAVDSRVLLRGSREIEIVHGDRIYRLRHTRNDKLILVK